MPTGIGMALLVDHSTFLILSDGTLHLRLAIEQDLLTYRPPADFFPYRFTVISITLLAITLLTSLLCCGRWRRNRNRDKAINPNAPRLAALPGIRQLGQKFGERKSATNPASAISEKGTIGRAAEEGRGSLAEVVTAAAAPAAVVAAGSAAAAESAREAPAAAGEAATNASTLR